MQTLPLSRVEPGFAQKSPNQTGLLCNRLFCTKSHLTPNSRIDCIIQVMALDLAQHSVSLILAIGALLRMREPNFAFIVPKVPDRSASVLTDIELRLEEGRSLTPWRRGEKANYRHDPVSPPGNRSSPLIYILPFMVDIGKPQPASLLPHRPNGSSYSVVSLTSATQARR